MGNLTGISDWNLTGISWNLTDSLTRLHGLHEIEGSPLFRPIGGFYPMFVAGGGTVGPQESED